MTTEDTAGLKSTLEKIKRQNGELKEQLKTASVEIRTLKKAFDTLTLAVALRNISDE